MRKVVVAVAILLVLLVGALAFAVANINGLLDENRERLAAMASEAAGREVSFDRAEVAFSSGLAVRVDGLRVAEDPRFGSHDFLALDSAFVGVEIWPALQRRIEVSRVRLDRPVIHVVQTAKGFNFSSLGGSGESGAAGAVGEGAESPSPTAVAIAALEISGGTVIYEDRTSADGLALTVEDLESTGTDLSLDGPIEIEFSGRIRPTRGENPAIESRVSGTAEVIDLETGETRLHFESPSFPPLLLGLQFEEGDVIERLEQASVEIGIPADAAKSGYSISLRSGAARLAGFDLSDVDAQLVYRGSEMIIDRLRMGVAGGSVELSGDLDFGKADRLPFDLATKLDDLDSGQLATLLFDFPPGFVSGRIGGNIELAGDSFDWEVLKRTLAGGVDLEIGEGALEQVNVLDNLVGRLVADPGLGALAANSLRDVAPGALKGDRTPFRTAHLALDIVKGALRAEAINLQAGDFTIAATGLLGLDGSVDGDGRIRFSESLSKKILEKADRLAPLLGEGQIVELPLLMKGSLKSPNLRPDLAALTASARSSATKELQSRAASELSKALFGRKRDEADAAPAEGEDANAPAAPREDAEEVLRKGLGRIFGN